MAVIAPQTDLYLLKSPLTMNSNTLSFSNATDQANYFLSLNKISVDDFTYQRHGRTIRFPAEYDKVVNYNYVMYKNTAYSNKWFYAFITHMQYINDNMTLISIATDVYQTWQFDFSMRRCFVEREHVSDDAIGANTIPEGLEYGDYICQDLQNWDYTGISSSTSSALSAYVCMGVTEKFDTFKNVEMVDKFPDTMNCQGGVVGGLTWFAVPNTYVEINQLISLYQENSKGDAIINLFILPTSYINAVGLNGIHYKYRSEERVCFILKDTYKAVDMGDKFSNAPTNLAGYTPRNKKLLCYPYCYELVDNNGGSSATYHWEDFTNRKALFSIYGTLTQGMSIKCVPTNYKSTSGLDGWEWSVTAQKLPTCSWSTDYYVSWINQQGANMANQRTWAQQRYQKAVTDASSNIIGNVVGGIASLGSAVTGSKGLQSGGSATSSYSGLIGNLAGSAGDLAMANVDYQQAIFGTLQQEYEAELVPNEAKGNVNSGDVNFSAGRSVFTAYDMCIKPEYARVIDDYFDMYGYKINRVKIPNRSSRKNWNYVKTIGCNITGNLPQDDITALQELFNGGITIWHNPSTMYDYSQSNSIN